MREKKIITYLHHKKNILKNYNRLIALIIILLLVLVGFVFANSDSSSDNPPTITTEQTNVLNIMIMGVDRRADDVGRSDTLMVLTYNPNEQKATYLFPHNLWFISKKSL